MIMFAKSLWVITAILELIVTLFIRSYEEAMWKKMDEILITGGWLTSGYKFNRVTQYCMSYVRKKSNYFKKW